MWEATEQCRVNTSVEWKRGGPPATFDVIAFLVAAAVVVVDIVERHSRRLDVVERARRKSAVCLASIIIVVAATAAATTRIWIRITNDGAPDRGRISEVLARHVVVFVFVSVCLADKEVSISVVSSLVLIVSYGPRCVDSSVKMASGIPRRNYCIIFKRSSHRSCSIR